MIENDELDDRHVLPRWVSISSARSEGMFARPGLTTASRERELSQAENERSATEAFERCVQAWRRTADPMQAEDLLAIAFISSREAEEEVQSAAMSVATSEHSGPVMKAFANSILDGSVRSSAGEVARRAADTREGIRRRKALIRLNPRDGLLLAETALLHTNLGQVDQSRILLRRATALAPHSRYVLRSAARFFCHVDEPERALDLLRNSPRHQTDPWLKSAELAIAGILGTPVKQWRQSKKLAEDESLSVLDRSELATELATLEFESGGRRAALKKVHLAVGDPTENAVAQIEFLAERTGDFSREELLPDISRATEARALSSYWKGELRSALDACEEWQELEPFSVRPAIFGSFLSTARNNAPERGIVLAKAGLERNPANSTLLNNLAVLYAYSGNAEIARQYAEMARRTSEDRSDIANIATNGLILFREGRVDEGFAEYEKAMDVAVEARRADLYLRAYSFLGREICRIDSDMKSHIYKELVKAEELLRKRNMRLPREVALMRDEFKADAQASAELSLNFSSLQSSKIEQILDK